MSTKIYKICLSAALIFASPFLASAQLVQTGTLLMTIKNFINIYLIPIVFSLALLLFFWGVVKYIWSEGQGKAQGKQIMVWGVVALFVMTSIWGIVRFLQVDILGGTSPSSVPIPTIGR